VGYHAAHLWYLLVYIVTIIVDLPDQISTDQEKKHKNGIKLEVKKLVKPGFSNRLDDIILFTIQGSSV